VSPPEPRTAGAISRVLIVTKVGQGEGARIAAEIERWLAQRGLEVALDAETSTALGRPPGVQRDAPPPPVDLVIVVGGDGTLLSVARSAVPLGIPILGVNFGSLGFLTELQPGETFQGLEAVLRGDYTIEERQSLRVRHLRWGELQHEHALLNDAVLTKSALARMITIDVHVDRDEVATYTSDGLIVSTPTGSTAYNLSAGGPILDPRLRAFVIAPICPHTMTYRPLVVPADVTVRVTLRSGGEQVYLTLDGQIGFPFGTDDALAIDQHPNSARLVRVAGRPFFEVLRRKLRWGER
jgi:NAD+ kinase